MDELIRLVGRERAVEVFGVRLVGVNAENGRKLLLTFAFLVTVWLLYLLTLAIARRLTDPASPERPSFWAKQAIRLTAALLVLFGILSIWFDDPGRLTTALGLVSAGLAFALQKVVTAIAGYFVILRGRTFNVGDRIVMGGVRGDVIALGFTQTTIMEMGQPPAASGDDPTMWVRSRQYTGRIVTVTNAKIFDEPVYNYTRDFPFLWEEMSLPVSYGADRRRAEEILLEVVSRHAVPTQELAGEAAEELARRYFMRPADVTPKVYWRLTDNWLELTARFVVRTHGIRDAKDAISRDLLAALDEAGIGIASTTFEIVGLPPLRLVPETAARFTFQSNGAHGIGPAAPR
jgi:small-conductance mechanosensitive channel